MTWALALLLLPASIMAQTTHKTGGESAGKPFTLEDLMPGGSTYAEHSVPKNMHLAWWGDRLVRLEADRCIEVDPAGGKEKTLFTRDDITQALPDPALRPDNLYGAVFPEAGQTLVLVQDGTQRAIVDWRRHKTVWRQTADPAASWQDWHTASRHLAYVKDHNLYVVTATGDRHTLSTDGSLDIVYGESVHRDEFGITQGTFWSPTGAHLAYYRMDQSMVSAYPQVNVSPDIRPGQSRCAQLVPDKYPMAGEASHKVSVGIYDLKARKTVWLDTGDPTDRYFTNIAWSPDEKTLYLIELNRDQNHSRLQAYDAATGRQLATLIEERDPKYVEPLNPIRFLPWDKNQFVYESRRDGYTHLYLYELEDGGKSCRLVRQLTRGQFEVISFAGFSTAARTLVYTSNEADPIGCQAWSVDMQGHRICLGSREGWHNPKLSAATGTYLADNWSSPSIARAVSLTDVRSARSRELARMADPWDAFKVPEIKVGTLKAADGKTDLYYRLVLPVDFDPARKYPAIVYVYGGPHAHNVDASRHSGVRGWDIWMAQKGYVMFSLDNRGSEHRGRDFEQATFRHLGDEEMKDQMCGVRYLKSLPYVDAERLGVHGWSFGGFMTTNLMTTYPDVFKVGVAGGPVIDWKYYEVMYGERYMDTPQDNPEGYASSSLLGKAGNLKGRLQIIYGGNDPTCVPQHTLSFLRACIDAGTHPDLFTYPGDGHNMMGPDRVHLHEHISRYFDDFLKR